MENTLNSTSAFDKLWQRLYCISQFHTQVIFQKGGQSGEVCGTVKTRAVDEFLWFEESGQWQNGTKVSNIYCWQHADNEQLILSEQRAGEASTLVSFPIHAGPTWKAVRVHTCGDDVYHASLQWLDDGLQLIWNISGPKKRAEIRIHYT